MRLLHGNEMHFVRCPDGRIYSTGVAVYDWWRDYLDVFDEVLVCARVKAVDEMWAPDRVADGPGIAFAALPDFRGPEEYLRQSQAVQRIMADSIRSSDACMFRVPGTIGYLGARESARQNRQYALEVVGDPYDSFAPGAVKHALRGVFRQWHARNLRRYCHEAALTMYVTEKALQRRYPPNPQAFTTYYSDVELPPEAFVHSARAAVPNRRPFRLIFVGTLEQLYKAPDVLIEAFHLCCESGLDATLTFAGEGGCQPLLEKQAVALGVADRIRFSGHIAKREELIRMLDEADAFVLPSRAEGLPRAMIEAMARGLPCIGSTVAGIPELLDAADLVPPDDAKALAQALLTVAGDSERRTRMSARNLEKARLYRKEVMTARKMKFCRQLRSVCEHSGVPSQRSAVEAS